MRHSKAPHNRSADPKAPHQAKLTNPLCGDEVSIFLHTNDSKIEDASFEGQCCALCTASASMLTQQVPNLDSTAAKEFATSLIDHIKSDTEISETNGDLKSLSGVAAFPSRKRCVTLPWETLLAALEEKE